MAIVHLQSGIFEQGSEEAPSGAPSSLTRRALLVYEGEFESMDGVVNVGRDELTTLATNHNGHVESASRLAEGKESMKDYPPVQLDHSTSAKDTVGRLIGKLELGEYKTKDGKDVMAAYGNVKILGEENVVKVMDGRWTHLSVGVDFEKGKFSELTITPFPAAPEASLLKKDTEMSEKMVPNLIKTVNYKGQKIEVYQTSYAFGSYLSVLINDTYMKRGPLLSPDDAIAKAKKYIDEGNQLSSRDTEMSEKRLKQMSEEQVKQLLRNYDLNLNNPHVKEWIKNLVEASEVVSRKQLEKMTEEWMDTMGSKIHFSKLSEGDKSMDKDKMKKHMMDEHKMSEKDAEEKLAKCTEEELKKLAAEVDEHEKKMAEKEDEDKKEMSEEKDDEKKEMSKEEEDEKKSLAEKEDEEKKKMESDEQEKKLASARDRIVRLSSDFRKSFEVSQLAAKKGKILSRLSALKASAKITPAEIKKIDVEKLAGQGIETVDLVLKTYEDREPVIMTGALGSIKADELHKLSGEIRMSRLEAETRKNMSLLKHTVKTKMQDGQAPEEVSIHVDTTPHVHQEMAKCYGDVCKMMDEGKLAEAKELLKKYMMKPESEGRMDMVEHDKQMSALAEESIKMQNKFDELQKLAVTLVG